MLIYFIFITLKLGSKDFALEVWKKSLNPLTWTEILRQVLVAAGFCSKQDALQKETLSKVFTFSFLTFLLQRCQMFHIFSLEPMELSLSGWTLEYFTILLFLMFSYLFVFGDGSLVCSYPM